MTPTTAPVARLVLTLAAAWIPLALGAPCFAAASGDLVFPADGEWESVAPGDAGWRQGAIEAALDFAGAHGSSHVVIVQRGRLLAERVFEIPESAARYQQMVVGHTEEGWPIEDVASVQKSVASFLAGVAEGKGLLDLDSAVGASLGEGWSRASPEQEKAITVRHLMTMTSGLDPQRRFVAEAGSVWRYNTNLYARVVSVLEAVTGRDIETLSTEWLTKPLGMRDSHWQVRSWVTPEMDANRYGFTTTARDLARFGLMILAGGHWRGADLLGNPGYLDRALGSSQELNPSYGLLWWLNGKEWSMRGAETERRPGPLVATAPSDMVAALGALGRKVWVVPSLELVVVRLGDAPGGELDARFWELLLEGAPGS